MLPAACFRLNPFRGLPNPREVWGWGMFDLANQSFAILINTLFFPIYFQQVIVGDEGRGRLLWGVAASGANLFVVLLGPVLGAMADARSGKKRVLLFTWIGCVVSLLLLSRAGEGMVVYAIACFAFATICYAAGENLVAALLPDIADAKRMARVSALGWTMGYAARCSCCRSRCSSPAEESPAPSDARIVVLAAVVLRLRCRPFCSSRRSGPTRAGAAAPERRRGRLLAFLRDDARRVPVPQRVPFPRAFFVYACGVQVIIYFSGIIVKEDFGFGGLKLRCSSCRSPSPRASARSAWGG